MPPPQAPSPMGPPSQNPTPALSPHSPYSLSGPQITITGSQQIAGMVSHTPQIIGQPHMQGNPSGSGGHHSSSQGGNSGSPYGHPMQHGPPHGAPHGAPQHGPMTVQQHVLPQHGPPANGQHGLSGTHGVVHLPISSMSHATGHGVPHGGAQVPQQSVGHGVPTHINGPPVAGTPTVPQSHQMAHHPNIGKCS